MKLLLLNNVPIHEQLLLEEALLRADTDRWCIINTGSPPAIVMGISGKVDELLNRDQLRAAPVPVWRRFSGGGTVYIDENTLFVTFIGTATMAPPLPKPLLHWSYDLYKEAFAHSTFALAENDYVLGDKKCGGNAQYIQKERWLHHTSFLWDYDPLKMDYLLLPKKRPEYRKSRSHTDFLCRLKDYFPSKEHMIETLCNHLQRAWGAREVTLDEARLIQERPHRQSTHLVSPL